MTMRDSRGRFVKLDMSGLHELENRLKSASVKVGILQEKGANEQHSEDAPYTVAEIAAVHEFGAPEVNIPERSFLRRTFETKKEEFNRIAIPLAKRMFEGSLDANGALSIIGPWGAAEVKQTITAGEHIPPPLKPQTIERKGSDRPLVDTGQLVNSIHWAVFR